MARSAPSPSAPPLQNVKLLRAYAKFVQEVLKDPARAQRLRTEAERRERAAEASAKKHSAEGAAGAVNEKVDAICVCSSVGVIRIANRNLHKLFGFKKDELLGKVFGAPTHSP